MINALVQSMDDWDHGAIMDYAVMSYRERLESTKSKDLVAEFHHNCFPEGKCDDHKCRYCKED